MNETIYIGAVKLKVLRKSIAIIIQNEPLENAGISQTSYSGGAFIGKTIITARLIKSLTAPVVFGAQINSGGSTAQVNSDWNATSGVAEILNKPTIPSDISQLTDNTGAIPSNTSDLTNDSNFVADAPSDSTTYGRKDASWVAVSGGSGDTLQTLTDVSTITWNVSLGNKASVTIAGNRAFSNPTNVSAGQTLILFVKQDGTGNRIPTFDTNFKFTVVPTFTSTPNKTDILTFEALDSTTLILVNFNPAAL